MVNKMQGSPVSGRRYLGVVGKTQLRVVGVVIQLVHRKKVRLLTWLSLSLPPFTIHFHLLIPSTTPSLLPDRLCIHWVQWW